MYYNENVSSTHAREDSLRMSAPERSMPVSRPPTMIYIDGRLAGLGSMHWLTVPQITDRSWFARLSALQYLQAAGDALWPAKNVVKLNEQFELSC